MSSNVAAIPRLRLRFKRPAPPSQWRLLYGLLVVYALDIIAQTVFRLALDTSWTALAFGALNFAIYAFLFWCWRNGYRYHKQLEEIGIALPPVDKSTWALVLSITVFNGVGGWFLVL